MGHVDVLEQWRGTPEARALLEDDADFAAWLDEEYVPIAGGWLY
jgi:hypothetical protein